MKQAFTLKEIHLLYTVRKYIFQTNFKLIYNHFRAKKKIILKYFFPSLSFLYYSRYLITRVIQRSLNFFFLDQLVNLSKAFLKSCNARYFVCSSNKYKDSRFSIISVLQTEIYLSKKKKRKKKGEGFSEKNFSLANLIVYRYRTNTNTDKIYPIRNLQF